MGKSKTTFMRGLPWPRKLKLVWFDAVGYSLINESLRAKIELTGSDGDGEDPENWVGLKVTIISNATGAIDTKYFTFGDYLEPKAAIGELVLMRSTADWVYVHPKTTAPLVEAIGAYVELWEK